MDQRFKEMSEIYESKCSVNKHENFSVSTVTKDALNINLYNLCPLP